MGPIDFTETSVSNYDSTLPNITGERSPALLRIDQPRDKTTHLLISQVETYSPTAMWNESVLTDWRKVEQHINPEFEKTKNQHINQITNQPT